MGMMRFLTFIFMFLAFPVMGQLRPNQFTTNVAGATGASNSLRHAQLFHPRFYNATSYLATAPGQPMTNFFYYGGIDSGAGGMPGMIDQYGRSILMCRKDVAHESDALFFGSTDTHWGAMTWDIQGAGWTTPTNIWPRYTTSFGSPGGQQAGQRFSQVNTDSINLSAWIEDPAVFAGTGQDVNVYTLMNETLIFGQTNLALWPTSVRGKTVSFRGTTVTSESNFVAAAALATSPVTVALAADNQVVSTTNRSFIVFTSDAAASSRTIILTPSNLPGARLTIMFSGSNGAEMADDQAQTGGGTTRTAGTLTFTDHDVVTFIFEGTDWRQATALLAN